MSPGKSLFLIFGFTIASIAAFIALCYGVFYALFELPDRHMMGLYEISPGVEVELFVESDWDVGDCLYYRIARGKREIVQKTYLTNHDRKSPMEIAIFQNAAGRVAGLYSQKTPAGEDPVFIILDLESGESWPRLRDNEASYFPAVQSKWSERYASALVSNPGLPRSDYFEDVAGLSSKSNP